MPRGSISQRIKQANERLEEYRAWRSSKGLGKELPKKWSDKDRTRVLRDMQRRNPFNTTNA